MKYHIQHKQTKEIRFGEWDKEYLYFLTDKGQISWMEYKHWEAYEGLTQPIKTRQQNNLLSIYKPYYFIDMELVNIGGNNMLVSVPFTMVRYASQYIVIKAAFGELTFKVSFFGKVYSQQLRAYQVSYKQTHELLAKFASIKNKLYKTNTYY